MGTQRRASAGRFDQPPVGEKASYYSAVCLETGEVELMELEGNSNAETSTAFLKQLREKHTGRLIVLWDNAPAHRGDAMRAYLATPELGLRLVNLPGYSPDFNADEAIWDWAREEVTANLCLGTKPRCRKSWGISLPSWLTEQTRSSNGVEPPCKHGWRPSPGQPWLVLITPSM